MNLEEQGKKYAETLLDAIEGTGVSTELNNPHDAFESGCYFGAVRGYSKGVNAMVYEIPNLLPDIFNEISESGFDMSKDWVVEFRKLILSKLFEIDDHSL